MLSSRPVTPRLRRLLPVLILPLLLGWYLLAQEAPDAESQAPLPATQVGTLVHDGRERPLAVALTPAGPLFAVKAIAEELGGELKTDALGQSYMLRLDDVAAVFGDGSSAMTVGEDIVMLSQAARRSLAAPAQGSDLLVPLDLLQQTWGTVRGYDLAWDPATLRLSATQRLGRDLPVQVDVVHVQGITTVVLQFPDQPRYRIVEAPGSVAVEMSGDRLQPGPPPVVEDPLVRGVEVTPNGVRLALAPGAAVDNYVLRKPFRIVFEVFQQSDTGAPLATPQPPTPQPGIHTIVIDPGHGGVETGAIGPSGTAEKDLTLLLAQALKSAIERRMAVKVVLTRSEDADLPLATRTAIANQNKADLFLSIHLNSSLGSDPRGAETYFLATDASDRRAAASAATENSPGAKSAAGSASTAPAPAAGDPLYDLQLMLWDLAQSRHLSESQRFAKLVQEELNVTLGLRDRGVKQAPFVVLMGAAMPAVLVELGFISNPDEETKLNNPAYRLDLVESLARAIERYRAQLAGEPAAAPAPAGAATTGAARPPSAPQPTP